ncbi:hypothetical protein D3C76_1281350 [compost metagenome]
MPGDQVFVAHQARHIDCRHLLPLTQSDERFDCLQARRDLLDQLSERQVEKQVLVLGVVGDEFDLLGEQPRVDRMQYRAHARHTEIQFHVPVTVPGQGADSLARLYTQRNQRIGHLFSAFADVGVSAVMHRSICHA